MEYVKYKLTRKEAIEILKEVNELITLFKNHIKNVNIEFIFKLRKIQYGLEIELKSLLEIENDIRKILNVYENNRLAICLKYCKKNEKGEPIVENKQFIIDENSKEAFENEIKKLKEKYKDDIETFNKKINELNKLLDETIEVTIPKLEFNELPKIELNKDYIDSFKYITRIIE